MKASPKDQARESKAQVLPPGSAPPDRTFRPDTQAELPSQASEAPLENDDDDESTYTSPADTLVGATSADLNRGLGHPGQGELGRELEHDGRSKRKKERTGNEARATGGSGLRDEGSAEARLLSRDTAEHNVMLEGAEDKVPVTSEVVDSERS